MSSTNKTVNYELSQYVGTDKPTYLGDYNSDMNKIDLQMKANNTLATAGDSRSTINATNIGNLTNLITTNKTDLVSAVNEVSGVEGTLSELTTSVKTDLVSAINEVKSATTTNAGLISSNTSDINDLKDRNVYALTETVCGEFLGKPLYRRVVEFSFASSDWNSTTRWFQKNVSDIITDVATMNYIFLKNLFIKDVTKQQLPASYNTSTTTNNQYGISYSMNGSRINLSLGTSYDYETYSEKTVTMIIEYTKSAD